MLHIHELDPSSSRLVAAIHARRAQDQAARPAGLHLSTITDDFMRTLYPEKFVPGKFTESEMCAFQELGNVYEDLIAEVLARKFATWTKPEPQWYRGMWCSPDGASTATRTIDEMKATWVSEKDFLTLNASGGIIEQSPKFHGYLIRILGYLKAWGWRRARLHVQFINGMYPKGKPAPSLPKTYTITASQTVIDQNWRALMRHAKDAGLR